MNKRCFENIILLVFWVRRYDTDPIFLYKYKIFFLIVVILLVCFNIVSIFTYRN